MLVVPVVVSSTTQSRRVAWLSERAQRTSSPSCSSAKDLVDGRAVQVAVSDRARLVRHQHEVTAVVHVPLGQFVGAVASRIDLLGNQPVKRVVRVGDLLRHHSGRGLERHLGQPLAIGEKRCQESNAVFGS